MNWSSFGLISIIVLIFLGSCQTQSDEQRVYAQLNEKVSLELYGYFKTVRGDFVVLPMALPTTNNSSETNNVSDSDSVSVSSGADLINAAVISTQADVGKIVTSAQLQVSSSAQVRIEVTTSDNLNYLFSYQLVSLQADNSIQTTVTATSTLTLTATGVLNEVSFSTATQGYFSVNAPDNKDANIIGSFAYSNTQGLSVSTTKIGFSVNQIKAYYFDGQEYLVSITSDSLGLVTSTADSGYDWSSLSSLSNEKCLSGSYVLSPLYPLLFCQTSTDNYQISAFYILNNSLTQVDYSLPQINSSQFSNIISSTSLSGVVFILSSDINDSSNSSLLVSKVLLNESSGQLTVQSFNIIVPQGYLGLNLPMYVQPGNLLVCFTETTVLGYNIINGQLLFERTIYFQQNFELLKIISCESTYQVVFINNQSAVTTNNLATIQYQMNIPAFTFTQTTSITKAYQLQLYSGLQYLNVYCQAITPEQPQYQVNSLFTHINSIVDSISLKGIVIYNIEDQFIGTNIKLKVQSITKTDGFYNYQNQLNSIDLLTNSLTVNINGIQSSNFVIYPTQGGQVLVVSNQVAYLAGLSVVSNNKFTLSTLCSENVLGTLIQKDINGFYSYSGSSLTQQIALPFQKAATGQTNCQFSSITTTCSKKDSNNQDIPFLFASDVLQAKVFSLCNSDLTIYTYKVSPFTLTNTPTIVSLTFKAVPTQMLAIAGKLFITDSRTYVVIYNYNVFPGYSQTINIPQTLGTISSVVLYSSSYLLTVTPAAAGSQVVYQLPYQDNAIPLRSLQLQGYTPNFVTATPLYQTLQLGVVLNQAQALPQMQEYYILPASNATSPQSILVFRINHVTAQNQLYKIFDIKATLNQNRIFATNTGYFGFLDSDNNGYLYTLNYWNTYFLNVEMTTQAFNVEPCQFFQPELYQNYLSYFLFYINFRKDISAANAIINQSDQNVQSLMSYFEQFNKLNQEQTLEVDLTNAVSSNVYGWIPDQKGLNSPVVPLVTNRIVTSYPSAPTKGLFDALYILQDVQIVSYGSTVDVCNMQYNVFYQDPQLFYDSSTMTSTYNSNDQSTTIVTYIYSVASDYQNLKQSLFSLCLTANYNPQYATLSLQMSYSTLVRSAPELDSDEIITKIQSDPTLGLLVLKKNKQSLTQTVCLLTVTTNTFSLDCDSLTLINSVGIMDVIWIPIVKINIFVSADGVLYTGFTKANSRKTVYSYNMEAITSSYQFTFVPKTLQFVGSIRSNCILISFDKINALEIQIGQPTAGTTSVFSVNLITLYMGENNLILTGQGSALSQTETLLLATDNDNNSVYYMIYSQYISSSTAQYASFYQLLRASAGQVVEDITTLSGQAKISQLDGQTNSVQILFNTYPGNNPKERTMTLSSKITVSMSSINDSDYSGVGAYLNLDGTMMNQGNSIPINIALGNSIKPEPDSYQLQIVFALWAILLFVMY